MPQSTKWSGVAKLSGILCILAAGALGLGAQMSLIDPYSFNYRRVELVWTHGARIFGVLGVAASACAMVTLENQSTALRAWSFRLLSLTLVGMSVLVLGGFAWAKEAEENGGDWAGLGVIVAWLFGVIHTGVIAGLLGLQLLALRRRGQLPPA